MLQVSVKQRNHLGVPRLVTTLCSDWPRGLGGGLNLEGGGKIYVP